MNVESAPPANLREFNSALIVKPSSLGDIVHTLPAVKAIRQAYPHLRIRWIANEEWSPLLKDGPLVDEVVSFPRKEFNGVLGAFRALSWARKWNAANRRPPEIVLDFQGLLRSGLIACARGAEYVIGLSDAREGSAKFYDYTVPVDPAAHAVDRYLALPRALGIPAPDGKAEFPLPEGVRPADFKYNGPFVLVHPYARGEKKALSAAALQTLCDCLARMRVVVVGVSREPPPLTGNQVVNLTNRTSLVELIWLMRNAEACVSVDSGPMHMAAAVNECTLGIHTWSDPRKVGPYDSSAWVWKAGRVAHRHEFTEQECARTAKVEAPEARRLADFVLGTMLGGLSGLAAR